MRIFLDEDAMAAALIQALRSNGFDVETSDSAGLRGRTDADQLAFATAERRFLYSFNRGDYARLHLSHLADSRSHGGIVLLGKRTTDIGTQLRGLLAVTEGKLQDDMRNLLAFI